MTTSHAWRKVATSKEPSSGLKNFIRFRDARLHAESSTNMYSEHGFDALMRCVAFTGFQRLIVESYCIPGSPQIQADSAIRAMRSRALYVFQGRPVRTSLVAHSSSFSTASMNSSDTRTEWLAFW